MISLQEAYINKKSLETALAYHGLITFLPLSPDATHW